MMQINLTGLQKLRPFLPPVGNNHLWEQEDLITIMEDNGKSNIIT